MLLKMHKWLTHILLPMHKGSQFFFQIMSCTSNFHMLFPKLKISVRGSIFRLKKKGEKILSKREHSLRGELSLDISSSVSIP
jgi:hypothetical protein